MLTRRGPDKNLDKSLGEENLNRMLTEAQTAEVLRATLWQLRHWRAKKTGPAFIRLSGRKGVRYLVSDLAAFIERQRVETGEGEGK